MIFPALTKVWGWVAFMVKDTFTVHCSLFLMTTHYYLSVICWQRDFQNPKAQAGLFKLLLSTQKAKFDCSLLKMRRSWTKNLSTTLTTLKLNNENNLLWAESLKTTTYYYISQNPLTSFNLISAVDGNNSDNMTQAAGIRPHSLRGSNFSHTFHCVSLSALAFMSGTCGAEGGRGYEGEVSAARPDSRDCVRAKGGTRREHPARARGLASFKALSKMSVWGETLQVTRQDMKVCLVLYCAKIKINQAGN